MRVLKGSILHARPAERGRRAPWASGLLAGGGSREPKNRTPVQYPPLALYTGKPQTPNRHLQPRRKIKGDPRPPVWGSCSPLALFPLRSPSVTARPRTSEFCCPQNPAEFGTTGKGRDAKGVTAASPAAGCAHPTPHFSPGGHAPPVQPPRSPRGGGRRRRVPASPGAWNPLGPAQGELQGARRWRRTEPGNLGLSCPAGAPWLPTCPGLPAPAAVAAGEPVPEPAARSGARPRPQWDARPDVGRSLAGHWLGPLF